MKRPLKATKRDLYLCLLLLVVFPLLAMLTAPTARSANLTDTYENKIGDHIFRGVAYSATSPAYFYVALFTSACTDSTRGTEVTGAGYARVAVERSTTAWLSTQGDDDVSAGTTGIIANAAIVQFPAPVSAWGVITAFGIEDAATGGNEIVCTNLIAPKTINAGDAAPSFGVGNLTIRIDN